MVSYWSWRRSNSVEATIDAVTTVTDLLSQRHAISAEIDALTTTLFNLESGFPRHRNIFSNHSYVGLGVRYALSTKINAKTSRFCCKKRSWRTENGTTTGFSARGHRHYLQTIQRAGKEIIVKVVTPGTLPTEGVLPITLWSLATGDSITHSVYVKGSGDINVDIAEYTDETYLGHTATWVR